MPVKRKARVIPKISIITPSFNQAEFIKKTIDSVVTQKGNFSLEYFIIDGGSTDGSVEIIKSFAKKYPFIKWQSKQDKGQVDAINKGLKLATGDIIAYINSDDYYLPETFQLVVNYFQTHPKKLWLVGNCRAKPLAHKFIFSLKHLWPVQASTFFLYLFNTINQPSVFLTKKLVQKLGRFNTKYNYAFDYDYWLRCSRVSLPARTRQQLSFFRIHQHSKGSSSFNKQFSEDLRVIKKYTSNQAIIFFHKLIGFITVKAYSFIK